MTETEIQKWEAAAIEAADRVCAHVEKYVTDDLTVARVAMSDAFGTNSLDQEFVELLRSRKHLTDAFLANA